MAAAAPSYELRDAQLADLPQVLPINEAAIPAVNSLTLEAITALFDAAADFRVAVSSEDGAVVGFMLCLPPGVATYKSPNYAFFTARYQKFLYIDRIAIAPSAQRRGLGGQMYAAAMTAATAAGGVLACEVNIRPRNDASLAFHDGLGFRSVGQQDSEGGKKTVTMLVYEAAP